MCMCVSDIRVIQLYLDCCYAMQIQYIHCQYDESVHRKERNNMQVELRRFRSKI